MRRIATASLPLLLAACATQSPLTAYTTGTGAERSLEQQALDFEKADITLRIEPASRSIRGDVLLTFGTRAPLRQIELDLDRNLPIDAIEVDGQRLGAGDWRNPEGKLTINLPSPLEPGKQASVRVRYHGKPHVAKKAPWDGGFVWSQTPDGQPWVASAVQGEGCDLFWPCIDHPTGKAKVVDEHISVPAPLVVAGNGVAMGMDEADGWRTYHWRTKNPSTYGISVNVGPYKELTGAYRSRYGNTIPLRLWYLPQSEKGANELFAEFPQLLDFFETVIGPYPFGDEKMGVVETPHKGMEHQTVNAYGNGYAKTPYGYDDLLQHEFAHEWFGNQLTNTNWDDMWLHEGFGTYMQPLYVQYLHGEQEYFASLMQLRSSIQNKAPIVSGKPKLGEEVYDPKRGGPGQDIYNKGALLLHTLRGLIGDEAFFRSVREIVYGTDTPRPGSFAPRYGTTAEFIAIAKRASGRDLDWFFQAYLYQAALPELQATKNGNTLQLAWKTEKNTPFPMPVEVRIGSRIVTVPMTDGRGSVELPAGAAAGADYTLDPRSKILRRELRIERFQQYREEQRKNKAA
ncbi:MULTISPECIES: M1 family metallopeptidase [unclassified Massilia]|uniref:M1 family metallopeptidase n=1 Tax=unclassified Massilia TaxID=2609279 RepID=UPI00178414EA|nr:MULTISPECIES: M1 family metallopeptidase [unclassified Massilia]MBD8529145.1 M1 family metallopeptidase [Massilia sp. CFBP 13647]MBD8672539.1 M1 family metallopeptidase [Massilia sp. CFBP 13721]